MKFTPNVETFAAQRRQALEEGFDTLAPAVEEALRAFGTDEWDEFILQAAAEVWNTTQEAEGTEIPVSPAFIRDLAESLALTTTPSDPPDEAQVRRIANWVAVYAINASTMAAADSVEGEFVLLEWVTMEDDDVRALHRPLDGVQRPVGETFTVGEAQLQYPGQPVGPPEVWINCRCVARPVSGGEMTAQTFASDDVPMPVAEGIVDEDEMPPYVDWAEEMIPVPIHGVLIDTTEETGDGRHLAGDFNVLSVEDGPVPLRWVRSDVGAHDGAVRVATIDRTWREGDRILYDGHMLSVPDMDDVITLLAEGRMGLSVDLDSAVFEVDEDDENPVMRFMEGRVRAATLVDIPALTGAWAELGSWADTAILAAGGCESCRERMDTYRDFAISEAAWDGSASRFTDEEWVRSTIVDRGESFETAKERYAMPIREPNGDLSRAAVHNAAARLNQVDAPDSAIASARRALITAYGELDEEPPESLTASGEKFQAPAITQDGPGWITHRPETSRLRRYWASGPGAARIAWGTPGDFNRCRANLVEYVQRPDWLAGLCANIHYDALGIWPGQHARAEGTITASAFTIYEETNVLPAAWFTDPELDAPTPVTVTEEGRVFGHIAQWGVCHTGLGLSVGLDDSCTAAPHSTTDYAYYRTGVIDTDVGEIPVGNLTMGIGHAGERASASATMAHYDNTNAVVADVVVGEDIHGIWFSGAMRPNLTDEQVREFKASTLSGDWRTIGGDLELVAALAVNVPGFPIPRLSLAAASGRQMSLIAAGILDRDVLAKEAGQPNVKTFADAVEAELARRKKARSTKARFRSMERKRLTKRL
jgi:hypothetical protein